MQWSVINHFSSQNKTPPGYFCEKCNRSYIHKANMKRHMKIECGKSPTISCPYCDYKTFYKHDVLKHIEKRHPESKNG